MKKVLEIGAGVDYYKGGKDEKVVYLDNVKLSHIDVVHDLNKYPYPFKDNEFDKIICNHILEHVIDLDKTLKEIKRISRNGAIIKITGPHFSCGVSYRDPTHKRVFSYFTFDYYTKDCFYAPVVFNIKSRRLNFTRQAFTFLNYLFNPLINISPLIYERFFCWIFPCAEVHFELEVVK